MPSLGLSNTCTDCLFPFMLTLLVSPRLPSSMDKCSFVQLPADCWHCVLGQSNSNLDQPATGVCTNCICGSSVYPCVWWQRVYERLENVRCMATSHTVYWQTLCVYPRITPIAYTL